MAARAKAVTYKGFTIAPAWDAWERLYHANISKGGVGYGFRGGKTAAAAIKDAKALIDGKYGRFKGMHYNPAEEGTTDFGWMLAEAEVHGAFNDAGNFREEAKALVRAGMFKEGPRFKDAFGSRIQSYTITGKGRRLLFNQYPEAVELVQVEEMYPMPRGPLKETNPMTRSEAKTMQAMMDAMFKLHRGEPLTKKDREALRYWEQQTGKKLSVPIPNKAPPVRKWLKGAITRRGKLGGKGFLSRPVKEQKAILDRCKQEYGYRSCLGSIMVLQRIPRTDARFGKRLSTLKNYLVKSYGGPGSFGPRKPSPRLKKGRRRLPNPNERGHFLLIPELTDQEPIMVKTNPAFEGEMERLTRELEGAEWLHRRPGMPYAGSDVELKASGEWTQVPKRPKKKKKKNPKGGAKTGLSRVMRSVLRGT